MNEGSGELNEAFVEMIIWLAALAKPEFFQDVVSFVEELFVKTFEVTEVMSIERLSL